MTDLDNKFNAHSRTAPMSVANAISQQVFGQDEIVKKVAQELEDDKGCSVVLCGPAGTGKSSIARVGAEASGRSFLYYNMAEMQERYSVMKITGVPPGYLGSESATCLADQIREAPDAVLFIDEIEKAHPSVFSTLLCAMRDGSINRQNPREGVIKVPLGKTKVMIATYLDKDAFVELVQKNCKGEAESIVKFLDAEDVFLKMETLSRNHLAQIADRCIDQLNSRLASSSDFNNVRVLAPKGFGDDMARDALENGWHGGRGVRAAVDKNVIYPLADWLAENRESWTGVSNGIITLRINSLKPFNLEPVVSADGPKKTQEKPFKR